MNSSRMRKLFLTGILAAVLLTSAAIAFAVDVPRPASVNRHALGELPAHAPAGYGRADTLNFGYYTTIGGNLYAVVNDKWTWDHGALAPAGDPFEGWYATDLTASTRPYFRQINGSVWSNHGNQVGCPIGAGTGSAWCGAMEDEADTLCWSSGLGYGNNWCKELFSPTLSYSGSGDVPLTFNYFNDSELNFDYTHVYLNPVVGQPIALNGNGFTSNIGVTHGSNPPLPVYKPYSRTILSTELGSQAGNYQLYFKFVADVGYSDEDGSYATAYGPFGVDDVDVNSGQYHYNFESGLQGWTPAACSGIGSFFSVQPLGRYTILDPCACALSGNVIAFHDNNGKHPLGQDVLAWSPPVRKSVEAPYPTYNQIFADYDMYAELPQANGVLYRPNWNYYPFTCNVSGLTGWSGETGQGGFFYVGNTPACYLDRNVATDNGIPPNCEDIGFVYEVYYSCEGVSNCTGQTNFTPIVDNVRIRFTGVPNAPVVAYGYGTYFQDNWGHESQLDVMDVGNALTTANLHFGHESTTPDLLGDSLSIAGPTPTVSSKYNSRLWFRVRREGAGQPHIARYQTWKSRVSTGVNAGINFVGETSPNKGRNFIYGWMDSVRVGTRTANNKYASYFAAFDTHHTSPQVSQDNKIIWDNMMTPGTQIQYFVTSNYSCTPNSNYLLPDTLGQNYSSFQILPSYRNSSDGRYKFPCILVVDANDNPAVTYYVNNALNYVINGVPLTTPAGPLASPTSWDVYKYQDANSNWKAPMFRNNPLGGNSGAATDQLLGYEMMMVTMGRSVDGAMWARDWQGVETWLTSLDCWGANQPRQGFYLSGDEAPLIVNNEQPDFLPNYLGSTYQCDGQNLVGCPTAETENDSLYCTKLKSNTCAAWAPSLPTEIYGNWCPAKYPLNVLGVTGNGCGRLSYQKKDDNYVAPGGFASVTNDASGTASNYRTVVNGYAIHHVINPDLSQGIPGECSPIDTVRIEQGMTDEIGNVIKWTLGISNPATLAGLCVDPCLNVTGPSSGAPVVENGMVNRLYQNSPNPFNPRTSIRFSLASTGPAKLVIFDVNGRKVRTLASGTQKAGFHQVVWDGLDDTGHAVASGIFWSQLSAGSYTSNKKMVVLK